MWCNIWHLDKNKTSEFRSALTYLVASYLTARSLDNRYDARPVLNDYSQTKMMIDPTNNVSTIRDIQQQFHQRQIDHWNCALRSITRR